MPLPMVHLLTADLVREMIPSERTNNVQYFLGSIIPDAIHMRKGATLKDKEVTHLDKFRPGLKERVDKLLETQWSVYVDTPLLLGYAVHLYTDAYWNAVLRRDFFPSYHARGITEDSAFRKKYYTDVDPIDYRLFQKSSRPKELLEKLSAAKGIDFLGLIRAQEMELWVKRTQTWFSQYDQAKENPYGIIFLKDIEAFIHDSADKICSDIKKLNLPL